ESVFLTYGKIDKLFANDWYYDYPQCNRKANETRRRLFQQFIVDGYCMMESDRLNWVRNNQTQLRVNKYNSLNSASDQSESQGGNKGKRIILPSSFVGGRRYMDQLYFDGMPICSFVGFPDLFITFTCNLSYNPKIV
ncbi:hypothetical protein Lal_00038309, partial [Lupinus albus]